MNAYPVPGGHGGAAAVDTTTEDEDGEAAEALAVVGVGDRRARDGFLLCNAHLSAPRTQRGNFETRPNPTVTLRVIGLRSVGWSTVRGPNIGHFGAFLGPKGVSRDYSTGHSA